MAKISVCMATYNGEKYIVEQLQSILKQISATDEVIISDDGSKDYTLDKINDLHDKRIKVVINRGKHGYTKNFENAIRNATGDYYILSDQDDVWLDNKVNVIKEALDNYDFVIHDCVIVNEHLENQCSSYFQLVNVKSGLINQLIRMRYLGCCMAFNKKVYNYIMPFPTNDRLVEHDAWIASVSEAFVKCKMIKEPLILYRRHLANTSSAGLGKGYPFWNKIIRRIYRMGCLLQVYKKIINEEI